MTETTETREGSRTTLYPDVPTCKTVSLATCPVTHGLVPVVPVETRENSDYGSASNVSSSTSVEHSIDPSKFSVFYSQFRRAIKIKKHFLPAKAAYFFFYMARSLFAAYFILFLTSTGLDPEQAGTIHGIRMVVISLSAFFWGFLTDKSRKDLLIICIKFISFAIIVFLKPWVAYWITRPESEEEHRAHIQEAVRQTLHHLNTTQNLTEIMKESDEAITKAFGLTWTVNHYTAGDTPLYLLLLILGVFSAFAGGALHVLLDSKVQAMTKEYSSSASAFGRQRLWGSLSYSVGPVFCGAVLESLPTNKVNKYMPVFYLHFIFMMLGLICCIILFKQKPKPRQGQTTEKPTEPTDDTINYEPIGKLVKRMLKNSHMTIFFINVLFMGVANGLQWSFQFLLMEELQVKKTFMGTCTLTQCLMESLLFPIGLRLIKAIGGNEVARTIGLFAYFLLFITFALCPNLSLFPVGTLFAGFGFTIYFVATMDELYYIGNPRCRTSLYALYNSISVGLGSGVAGVVGGFIYKTKGGRALYFMGAMLYLALTILSAIYTILYKKSIVKGWDRTSIYTKFSNSAAYSVKSKDTQQTIVTSSRSDEAISLTMVAETSV